MRLKFYKYHGTGNDFILVDNRKGQYHLSSEQVVALCDRHQGIGSDGLILIEASSVADYNMNFFNPDGSKSYCGNGSRCAFTFAQFLEEVKSSATFEAIDGIHSAEEVDRNVRISLHDVTEAEEIGDDLLLNTGSPHY
ncbi:MAG: diaminopimelate epimerase, partial [Flavobacteriales bacterium]|nr:diaminopimelate epimerase [Flavobacteriales bacterium]